MGLTGQAAEAVIFRSGYHRGDGLHSGRGYHSPGHDLLPTKLKKAPLLFLIHQPLENDNGSNRAGLYKGSYL